MSRRQSTQILNEINELRHKPRVKKQSGIDRKVFGGVVVLEETVTEGVKRHDSTFTLRTAAVVPDQDLRDDPEKLAKAEAETKLPGE
ncbi:hypothetical protein [Propionimicrobium sp. BV2F7]|uniref:hypothetical protein n=1 Tax=Propionimicrobium sp. BV2F7 TaxID=1111131 RepID=UPI0003D797CC|nr:hypothetical protein [Propionimicrobium sp. BV2F7]ETJ97287.1 hypothetical protein HMPREF1255_0478 [Propionimicrobium sp. BV2F7]